MKILHSLDELPVTFSNDAIFLAGPTPRDRDVRSWRPEAKRIFEELKFDGTIICPEYSDDRVFSDYFHQTNWEKEGLIKSTCIMFWVPRNLETMPAFTTNVEFGRFVDSGKIIYGRPPGSPKCEYLDWVYKDACNRSPTETLLETVLQAMTFVALKKVKEYDLN